MSEGLMADKVAVVTGGGGGISSAICKRLAQAGARVVLTYRQSEAKARAVAASLVGDGHLVMHAPVEEKAALKRLADQYGTVDLLVNNAGVTRRVVHNDLDALDDDLIDEIFRVKWRGAFATIRALKELLANDEGGVVDIYRRDGNKLAENWIFIDMLYFLNQQGLDVLERNRLLQAVEKSK